MVSKVRYLLSRIRRSRWVLVVLMSLVVSGLEAIGAALVLFLIRMIADPENGSTVPVLGDLRRFGRGTSERTLPLVILGSIGLFFLIRAHAKILQTYVQQRVVQQAGLRLSARLVEARHSIRERSPRVVHTTLFEANMVSRLAAIGSGVPVAVNLVIATRRQSSSSGAVRTEGGSISSLIFVAG